MTIAARVSVLFVCSGLFLSGIAATYVAQREYQLALNELVTNALARVQNRTDLQFYIYSQNSAGLNRVLSDFLEPDAVSIAGAYNNLGELLAGKDHNKASSGNLPPLNSIRGDASITDTSLTSFDKNRELGSTGFWSSLMNNSQTIHLATPVFSPVNPLTKGQTLANFADALNHQNANSSLVVIGYLYLAIERTTLLHDLLPAVLRVFFISLAGMLLCTLLLYSALTRITHPLTQLKQLAGGIVSGEGSAKVQLEEGNEFHVIALVLNSMLEDKENYRSEIGLEHKLLQLQSDERASLLNMREQELSRAAEEINTAREQLHQLANYDRLTSLPNRQLFAEQLNVLLRLCARDAKPLALLFINLNNFHRINESLGRSTGDIILQEVGKRLIGCLRSSDMLAHYVNSVDGLSISRLGGDEFAVVLSQLDNVESAGIVAQRVTDRLVESMQIDGHELVVTPSIGIAVAPRNGMDVEGLLKAASIAMHSVKSAGNSSYLYYNEQMVATGQDDFKLESELRKAIERNELSLHYQPQVDTSDGSIICAEALLRWEHPEYGFVAPSKFIELAEKVGLIGDLGDWALVEACRQMKAFKDQGIKLSRIAINISPQQFTPAFATRVQEVLTAAELSPSMLELGLSETILKDSDQNILKFLQDLKATGVYLSLENFGTNHAPISYLSRYPLDEIKVDRSFVADCDKRKDAARLVKAILAMAKSLELHTVAEGVETEGEYRFLTENGVGIMRGYLFSKPVPAEQLKQLLVVPWHFMTQLQRMVMRAELTSSQDT
ncbi:MAG: EAL domain-containing protein [Halioglobus sp.]